MLQPWVYSIFPYFALLLGSVNTYLMYKITKLSSEKKANAINFEKNIIDPTAINAKKTSTNAYYAVGFVHFVLFVGALLLSPNPNYPSQSVLILREITLGLIFFFLLITLENYVRALFQNHHGGNTDFFKGTIVISTLYTLKLQSLNLLLSGILTTILWMIIPVPFLIGGIIAYLTLTLRYFLLSKRINIKSK